MNVKLTLKMDSDIIEQAKTLALSQHTSLSRLVENYFRMLTAKRKEPEEVTPLVRELSGIISLDNDRNVKDEYADYLTEKYR
jgi:hypothetical protein